MADDLTASPAGPTLLTFTPDETEIQNAAATFAAAELPLERLHGPDAGDLPAAILARLADLGWFGLALPERLGGSGLTAVEHALFFREIGRHCGPLDILTQALAAHAAEEASLRSALLAGGRRVALATPDGSEYRLLGAPQAELALLAAPDGASLFELADLAAETRAGLDPATSLKVATHLGAPVALREGADIWDLGQLGAAAMLVGLAETALDQIVEYAKIRETFGRKIGAYQAVRHPCADMAMRAEAARAQLWFAAAALKGGRPDARAHLTAAKHLANEAALANADANIQLHGGVGVTDEHHAHLILKRALLLSRLFGARRVLLEELLHAKLED